MAVRVPHEAHVTPGDINPVVSLDEATTLRNMYMRDGLQVRWPESYLQAIALLRSRCACDGAIRCNHCRSKAAFLARVDRTNGLEYT